MPHYCACPHSEDAVGALTKGGSQPRNYCINLVHQYTSADSSFLLILPFVTSPDPTIAANKPAECRTRGLRFIFEFCFAVVKLTGQVALIGTPPLFFPPMQTYSSYIKQHTPAWTSQWVESCRLFPETRITFPATFLLLLFCQRLPASPQKVIHLKQWTPV